MGLFDFLANAPAGSPTSYQGMEGRRRIALQLLANSKKGYPKTIGEGLTAVGDAIGDRGVLNQLAAQEAAYQKQAAAVGAGLVPEEARTPGPQSEADAPVKTAYASESDTPAQPAAAPASSIAGYRPAPAYLRAALEQDVADPERRAYLGQLAGKEAQSADEVSSTGAAGPFQFTRGTGRQYGLMPDGQDMRTDIHGSIAAAQNLTDDNAATLTKMLGRPPSPSELALAHQQGAVTAGRMLTGTGNAPAANLAVNNVNPAASSQAAAAKIMGYYGMPGQGTPVAPRDAIAATLAQRQGVPQPNPTLAGAQPPSAALPLSGSATPPGGAADLPPEILTGASAIRAAPSPPSPIQAAPVQVAQAQPSQAPQVVPTGRVPLLQDVPMTSDEKRGWNAMAGARALGDPELIAQAQALIASGAAQRKQEYEVRLKDWQDQVLAARQRQMAEEAFAREQGTPSKAAEADILKRTGMTPAQFYPEMDKEKASIDQTVRAQDAQRLARKAIKDGVITGYGANMKIATAKFADWAFNNGLKGDLAANTEIMQSALTAGLSEAVKTINGEGGTGVSNTDVRIAQGMAGTDPNLQMKTIQSIMDRAGEINNRKIGRYEEQVDKYLSGHPQELRYTTNARPTAPPDHLKTLLESQKDPDKADSTRAYFDKTYGPGAAELEIARFKRTQRRQGGG